MCHPNRRAGTPELKSSFATCQPLKLALVKRFADTGKDGSWSGSKKALVDRSVSQGQYQRLHACVYDSGKYKTFTSVTSRLLYFHVETHVRSEHLLLLYTEYMCYTKIRVYVVNPP